jgi:hypothetical protein
MMYDIYLKDFFINQILNNANARIYFQNFCSMLTSGREPKFLQYALIRQGSKIFAVCFHLAGVQNFCSMLLSGRGPKFLQYALNWQGAKISAVRSYLAGDQNHDQ